MPHRIVHRKIVTAYLGWCAALGTAVFITYATGTAGANNPRTEQVYPTWVWLVISGACAAVCTLAAGTQSRRLTNHAFAASSALAAARLIYIFAQPGVLAARIPGIVLWTMPFVGAFMIAQIRR